MSQITLTAEYNPGFTLVPDAFIERFLSGANGEYIKVYLYLLRCLQKGQPVLISEIADALEKEEADVLRAIKYWEKKDVFKLEFEEKELRNIYIKELSGAGSAPDFEKAFKSSHALPVQKKDTPKALPEDVTLLITAAQGYFSRPVTLADQNSILYMYDDLGMSFELIDYLFCRAVETNKMNLRYIEKVALTLYERDIKTVNEAMSYFKENSDLIHKVMCAFGLQSRNPTTAEQKYIDKWSDIFGFDNELIAEACSRSSLNTNSGNFQYADKILTSWHEAGVRSRADVEKLDAAHKASSAKSPKRGKAGSKPSGFNNFEQRGADTDELEKRLLGT